jgi:hypothetical protein
MIKFCFTKKWKLADRIQQEGRGEDVSKYRYTFDFMTITYESLRNLR